MDTLNKFILNKFISSINIKKLKIIYIIEILIIILTKYGLLAIIHFSTAIFFLILNIFSLLLITERNKRKYANDPKIFTKPSNKEGSMP